MNIQDWFPLGLTYLISLQSKGLSRVFSNTTVQKHQFFITQLSEIVISESQKVQLTHPYMTTGKTIALTRQTLVGKVVSLLFNMLFRLVTIFLPRSKVKVKSLGRVWLFVTPWTVAYQAPPSMGFSKEQASFNFLAAITICSDFGAPKNSQSLFPLFPYLFAMKWWDQMPINK